MLSIGAMKSGQESYYQNLAQEDYYLQGGEPPGCWHGQGAGALGLSGVVQSKDLSSLFRGYATNGNALVQNAGQENRQSGWDLTFSAPKSVSVVWSQLDAEDQRLVQTAQATAVAATITYLEEHCAFSRVGRGGTDQVKVGLIAALFEHSCSRALDPQLHTHCLIMNLGVDAAGETRSILSKPFYEAKMLAGAYYRCELAQQLQQLLGVAIERPRNKHGRPQAWFEIEGVPKSILFHFSKRRAAIEAELGSRGMESASAAAFAALSTREAKSIIPPRSELHADWKQQGVERGFAAKALITEPHSLTVQQKYQNYQQALATVIAEITYSDNFFSKAQLTRAMLEASPGLGLSAAAVCHAIESELEENPYFIALGMRQGAQLWTIQEVLDLEKEFLDSTSHLRQRQFTPVADKHVLAALDKTRGQGADRFTLDAEQQAAVRYITQGKESIKIISGFAGTGKTDMLSAAKEALEQGGYRVIGTALAGVAARTLQEKTGIAAESVRMREFQLYPGLKHKLKHHAKQLVRAAQGKTTYQLSPLKFDKKTVLIIDEAGMVGTRDFALLAKAVVDQGGSIVAVGDEKQLASIERGGCFDLLVKELGGVRLTAIRRQKDLEDRQAVKEVVFANPEEALQHYASKGQFFVGQKHAESEAQLIADWVKQGGTQNPEEHRIFAATKAEVARFNQLAQAERVRGGLVDAREQVEHQGETFMVGDRVRFNATRRQLGILKGEGGTIVACKDGFTGKYVAVQLNGETRSLSAHAMQAVKHHATQLIKAALGKKTEALRPRRDIVLVPLQSLNPLVKPYEGLSLDYAMTTHLGQGQTVKNSYVLLGGRMTDRELTYVQTSRHQEKLFLYANQMDAGQELTRVARTARPLPEHAVQLSEKIPDYSLLAKQMKLSHVKELAITHDSIMPVSNQEHSHVL